MFPDEMNLKKKKKEKSFVYTNMRESPYLLEEEKDLLEMGLTPSLEPKKEEKQEENQKD